MYTIPCQWDIPKEKSVDIITYCNKLAYNKSTSKLNCKISFSRENIEISLDEFNNGYKQSKFTHEYFGVKCKYPNDTQYLSIGFVYDLNHISYYLMLDLDIKYVDELVKDFNLIKM